MAPLSNPCPQHDRDESAPVWLLNAPVITADGVFVPGPFTLDTRREILDKVLAMQAEMSERLIADEEVARIKTIWAEDVIQMAELAARNAAT